jgi:hypothetical protein
MAQMKGIKQIEGKTIKSVEHGGGNFEGKDNSTFQLSFTDGTTLCINFETETSTEVVFYKTEDEEEGKLLLRK